ncbi:MAG: glycosyltransferase family 2 protein [Lachnospiraceae bacterium]|nr:glycosyltransferase family 2 protein [Lachnospiraceae bacterium]
MSRSTIVIPNYNGEKFLTACLQSVFDDDPDTSVIVVDNASADESLSLIAAFPQVRVICFARNMGFSAAVNAGILAAETEFVILLNNDTTVKPGFVKALEEAMDRHPKAFSVGAQMLAMQDESILDNAGDFYCALGWAYGYGKGKKVTARYLGEYPVFSACAGAAAYRRAVFDRIGLFDEAHFAYLEDLDIGYRAKIYGYENYYTSGAVVLHAGSATSGSKYNEFKINLSSQNSIYVIGKNMPFLQWLLNLPFFIIGFGVKAAFFCMKGYGRVYIRGLGKGLNMSCSDKGRQHHVKVTAGHLRHYVRIQGALWVNILRRFLA